MMGNKVEKGLYSFQHRYLFYEEKGFGVIE